MQNYHLLPQSLTFSATSLRIWRLIQYPTNLGWPISRNLGFVNTKDGACQRQSIKRRKKIVIDLPNLKQTVRPRRYKVKCASMEYSIESDRDLFGLFFCRINACVEWLIDKMAGSGTNEIRKTAVPSCHGR